MKFSFSIPTKNLPQFFLEFITPLQPILFLFPLYVLFYFLVWQGIETAKWKRMIHQKNAEKEDLVRKNDELKIGIVSYTSAERIEALYRKTYQYLPISLGNRTVTIELPPVPTPPNKDSN